MRIILLLLLESETENDACSCVPITYSDDW